MKAQYMNTPVKLPSGKILNIARFIALLPINTTTDTYFHLILEGYSTPINLELRDANALKEILQLETESLVTTDIEWERLQLGKNQQAIAILAKRIERNTNMPQAESMQREELFEDFKQTIDAERLPGQKLYSLS